MTLAVAIHYVNRTKQVFVFDCEYLSDLMISDKYEYLL